MSDETNGFERAASALGKVEKMVRSGDGIFDELNAIRKQLDEVRESLASAEKTVDEATHEFAARAGSVSDVISDFDQRADEISSQGEKFSESNMRRVAELEMSIRSSQEKLVAGMQAETLSLSTKLTAAIDGVERTLEGFSPGQAIKEVREEIRATREGIQSSMEATNAGLSSVRRTFRLFWLAAAVLASSAGYLGFWVSGS